MTDTDALAHKALSGAIRHLGRTHDGNDTLQAIAILLAARNAVKP